MAERAKPGDAVEPEARTGGVACPHCGEPLRAEHDSDDHMHCDSSACIGCCFNPGEPPTLRPDYPLCPSGSILK